MGGVYIVELLGPTCNKNQLVEFMLGVSTKCVRICNSVKNLMSIPHTAKTKKYCSNAHFKIIRFYYYNT